MCLLGDSGIWILLFYVPTDYRKNKMSNRIFLNVAFFPDLAQFKVIEVSKGQLVDAISAGFTSDNIVIFDRKGNQLISQHLGNNVYEIFEPENKSSITYNVLMEYIKEKYPEVEYVGEELQ